MPNQQFNPVGLQTRKGREVRTMDKRLETLERILVEALENGEEKTINNCYEKLARLVKDGGKDNGKKKVS